MPLVKQHYYVPEKTIDLGATTLTVDTTALEADQQATTTKLQELINEIKTQRVPVSVAENDNYYFYDPTDFKIYSITGVDVTGTVTPIFKAPTSDTFIFEPFWDDTANDKSNLVPIYAKLKVAGDGTTTFVEYVEHNKTTVYPLIGTALNEHEIGEPAETNVVAFQLTPTADFITAATMTSVSVRVKVIGDPLNPPHILTTAADGAPQLRLNMDIDEAYSFNSESTVQLKPGMVIQSTHADDVVKITYTNFEKI